MLQIILGLLAAVLMLFTVIIARNMITAVYDKYRDKSIWKPVLLGIVILLVEMLILVSILALMSI